MSRAVAGSYGSGGKVKTIAHNWHMKFKEARARRRGWKGQSLTQYTHAPVFEPLFFSLPSSSLEIYISSLLARTVCLSRFLLKSRWWLCPIPCSTAKPSPPSNFIHPPPPLSFPRRFSFSFVLSSVCERGEKTEVRLPRTRSTSSSAYTETILHLRRDYASLADNRKYAIE